MTKETTRWRAFLVALCALSFVLCAFEFYVPYVSASAGFGVSSAHRPYLRTISSVAPGSPAARSGLRVGDILDVRPMSAPDRFRLYFPKWEGETIRVYVLRDGTQSRVTVATKHNKPSYTWDVWAGYAGSVWMLVFALVLALRCPHRRDARALALLLIGLTDSLLLNPGNFRTPWPALDAVAAMLSELLFISGGLLATYSVAFAEPASRLRGTLLWLSYAALFYGAVLGAAWIALLWTGAGDPYGAAFTSTAAQVASGSVPWALPVLCGAATIFETRAAERTRFLWAFVPLASLYITQAAGGAATALNLTSPAFAEVENAFIFIAPLGLTYSLLNRRLLDIGFVLNRAAVFSAVSVLLVGTFVLVEWALSDWLQHESHSTNLVISGALALLLGLSMRFVHGKVEHFVDYVMFRTRRENEEAIRRMAREAPYITDQTTLLKRAERVLIQHAEASSAGVLLDGGNGFYGTVTENDPALVALRAEHTRVDLHALETSIAGEWAYPMVARGRLVGALVLGPKRSQESYAPDESAAIAQLAHSLAGALDVFALNVGDADQSGAILRTMKAGFAELSAQIARMTAENDPDVV